jgi:hypothetical protein
MLLFYDHPFQLLYRRQESHDNLLTLWSPSPSEAWSLLTFLTAHARVQLVPTHSCMYYKVHELNLGLVGWELSWNSTVFGAGIWGLLVALFRKKRKKHHQLFTVTLWSAVCAVGVLFVLILEFSERKETVWCYPDCKVPLCVSECFKLYHTKLNYLYIQEMCLVQIFFW